LLLDSTLKKLTVCYKVYQFDFSKVYFNKSKSIIVPKLEQYSENRLYYLKDENEIDIISSSNLEKEGNISRGISFGNNQDLALNSNLNLQLNGKINDELSVLATITDDNIPIQAEGNTQQIQDFDKVFIQLYTYNSSFLIGDLEVSNSESYFLKYAKKVKGADYKYSSENLNIKKYQLTDFEFGGAVGKGNYNRMTFNGIEGNQGPYKLTGKSGENYIIVLSGSEKVYIDGILQTRGEENDYVIDYNSAELTFTAKQLITKDKRIIIEFEYSEQNYSRFLGFYNSTFANKNTKISLSAYSEQDSKNQSLQYQFTDEQKKMLYDIGDNIDQAISQNIDSIGFDDDKILYLKKDTVVENVIYNGIYEYSTNPERAHFLLTFSNVGENNGNYIQEVGNANGKTFRWIAPVNNIPQGNYEPVILIITPKKKQVFAISGNSKLSDKSSINYELGISNYDVNTFSDINNSDNLGYSMKINSENYILGSPEVENSLNFSVDYTYINKNFNSVEYFKETEFERSWNLELSEEKFTENYLNSILILTNKSFGNLIYTFSMLQRVKNYQGYKNELSASYLYKKLSITQLSDFLISNTEKLNTKYFVNSTKLSRNIFFTNTGIILKNEYNKWTDILTDSLNPTSYKFDEISFFIENNDTTNNSILAQYTFRNDFATSENRLNKITSSKDFTFKLETNKQKLNNFDISVIYRKLNISDTSLTSLEPENNLTSSVQHNLKLFKSAISSSLKYESGSGLEQKKEYLYVEVNQGQGTFQWIDFNSNGLKEIDEFEIANYTDEANYIRVFTQSNNYVKTYNNKLSYILLINPKKIWAKETGLKNLCAKFSNNFTYRIEQKANIPIFPLSENIIIDDTSIVSSTEYLRNLVTFNKNGTFSIDYIIQKQKNKILLVPGIDTKSINYNNIVLYLNILDTYLFSNSIKKGQNIYNSQYFTDKMYNIVFIENEVDFNYQLNNQLDLTVLYTFNQKENIADIQKTTENNIGLETNYSLLNNANILLNFNYINIKFNSTLNSSISYVMLESLKPGNNFTWSLNLQKVIFTNLQLNVLYEGRYSEESEIIHSGNIQIRALF